MSDDVCSFALLQTSSLPRSLVFSVYCIDLRESTSISSHSSPPLRKCMHSPQPTIHPSIHPSAISPSWHPYLWRYSAWWVVRTPLHFMRKSAPPWEHSSAQRYRATAAAVMSSRPMMMMHRPLLLNLTLTLPSTQQYVNQQHYCKSKN
jgi:hypothetical protein